MKTLRLFPRRTKATPNDENVRVGALPGWFDEADEILLSVAFSWDIPLARMLEKAWDNVAPVRVGGPAFSDEGGDYVPGKFLREGYVITSRGCPECCSFCDVWRREGEIRELPIREGWNLLDNNILACSEAHQKAVFEMLSRQTHRVELTGGLQASRLKKWHLEALKTIRPKQMFFAYDEPGDLEPLREAGKLLLDFGGWTISSHALRAYVLCGYPGDTLSAAEKRMLETMDAGFMPMAMAWRDGRGELRSEWSKFQRAWARPAIMGKRMGARENDANHD